MQEDWKSGRLKCRKIGRLEDWKMGRWDEFGLEIKENY